LRVSGSEAIVSRTVFVSWPGGLDACRMASALQPYGVRASAVWRSRFRRMAFTLQTYGVHASAVWRSRFSRMAFTLQRVLNHAIDSSGRSAGKACGLILPDAAIAWRHRARRKRPGGRAASALYTSFRGHRGAGSQFHRGNRGCRQAGFRSGGIPCPARGCEGRGFNRRAGRVFRRHGAGMLRWRPRSRRGVFRHP
jgi:hypothetical protein